MEGNDRRVLSFSDKGRVPILEVLNESQIENMFHILLFQRPENHRGGG